MQLLTLQVDNPMQKMSIYKPLRRRILDATRITYGKFVILRIYVEIEKKC